LLTIITGNNFLVNFSVRMKQHSERRVYCFGEVLLDIIFPKGEPVAAKVGGSMLNTAVSLARTGIDVKLISEIFPDEAGNIILRFLKENNIPVLLDDPFNLPEYDYSDTRLPFKLAAMFKKERILVGLTYSVHAYGNLPFAAGQTVSYGLTKEEALRIITLNNAKILGIDEKTGSLEVGKDANIVVSTGDILDMKTNNIEYAFISGRNISLDNKHKQLSRRFEAKYENITKSK